MSTERNSTGTPKTMRNIFGIIMIVIYLTVGILFLCNFFEPVYGQWTWVKWVGGIMFILYGIWRAYRQFAGIDKEIGDEY